VTSGREKQIEVFGGFAARRTSEAKSSWFESARTHCYVTLTLGERRVKREGGSNERNERPQGASFALFESARTHRFVMEHRKLVKITEFGAK
jgi:hypothetical protein